MSRLERLAERITPTLFLLLAVGGALLVATPRGAGATACLRDGQTCRTNQSCCSGICVKSAKKSFGTCCTPTTCAAVGANCGMIADGCGGTLNCGTCTLPQTCGGGGTPNVCGSTTTTTTTTTTSTITTTTTLAPVCGDGIREVGEQCDGGAYCSASCTLPSLAPGCCRNGSTPGCADASGWSLDYYMYNYCLSHGWSTNVDGGVCSQAGTCDILPLQPVPLCCESNTDGTCSHDDTVSNTGALWWFFNHCEGITNRSYHTVPAATCDPAGTCVPG